jgi:hypothetical protein
METLMESEKRQKSFEEIRWGNHEGLLEVTLELRVRSKFTENYSTHDLRSLKIEQTVSFGGPILFVYGKGLTQELKDFLDSSLKRFPDNLGDFPPSQYLADKMLGETTGTE